ncbi:nuclear transport factor 2 family protein [Streptomyces sp. SID11385]|uniref:nuclear transport factor 2 family protein n=1 Tax=Streptomyces sp. SID11385 TaxID=2706031 RepID=UPI0013CCA917|nr:nuclear transport factor 2 family protein [Streptomyces sp. SID11385]
MSDVTTVAKKYIETWNITDAEERRRVIGELFTEDTEYADPNTHVTGRAALDAYIAETQRQIPGGVFTLAGEVSTHHDFGRFTWQVGPAGGGAPFAVGYDFIAVEGGRVSRLYGFFS